MHASLLDFRPLKRAEPLPEALHSLFGDDLPTYALIDGAQVMHLPALLEDSGLQHVCLFDGEAASEFGEAAPWLVKLDPDASFTAKLFTEGKADWHLWGKARFVLLRSSRSLPSLKSHFKRFIRPAMDGSGRVMFRFWDALIWSDYIAGTKDLPERAARLLSDAEGWCCALLGLCTGLSPYVALYTPAGTPPAQAPVRFDDIDRTALQAGVERRMRQNVAERLAPKFETLTKGGSGFAKDYTRGAFDFIKANVRPHQAIDAEDVFQLALLGYLWGNDRKTILQGPVFTEPLIPISMRIALARESYFETLKQLSKKET